MKIAPLLSPLLLVLLLIVSASCDATQPICDLLRGWGQGQLQNSSSNTSLACGETIGRFCAATFRVLRAVGEPETIADRVEGLLDDLLSLEDLWVEQSEKCGYQRYFEAMERTVRFARLLHVKHMLELEEVYQCIRQAEGYMGLGVCLGRLSNLIIAKIE